MAKNEKSTTAQPAPVATANVSNENVSAEQAANIADLNDKQAAPEPKKEPTQSELKQAVVDATQAYATAVMADDDAKLAEAGRAMIAAKRAMDEFNNKLAAEKAQAELTAKTTDARALIASAFSIDDAAITAILANDAKLAEAKQPTVKDALLLVFGKPVIHAKEGQTGASVQREGSRKGTGQEILNLWNDGNGLDAKTIIEKGYARGTVHSVILERKRELGIATPKA